MRIGRYITSDKKNMYELMFFLFLFFVKHFLLNLVNDIYFLKFHQNITDIIVLSRKIVVFMHVTTKQNLTYEFYNIETST